MKRIGDMIAELKATYPPLQMAIAGLRRKNEKEYCGPCPVLGCDAAEDGFIVFAESQEYWCRKCNCSGDIVDYYQMIGKGQLMDQLRDAGLTEEKTENPQYPPLFPLKNDGNNNLPTYIWHRAKIDPEATEIIRKAFGFRGIHLKEIPLNIRLNKHKGQVSVVCVMQSPTDTKTPKNPLGIHLTTLDTNGKKSGTKYQGQKKGLAIMLPSADPSRWVIGEGLENTLSAMQVMSFGGIACGDAGNMASMSRIPAGCVEVYILADSDVSHVGQKAALCAAKNIEEANPQVVVRIVSPDASCFTENPTKKDFNDLLMKDPSGVKILKRFEAAQSLRSIGWRPPDDKGKGRQQDIPLPPPVRQRKPEPELWSFAEAEEVLQDVQLRKWMICTNSRLTALQKYQIAEDILLFNNFSLAEMVAVKDLVKKNLEITKGEQEKLLAVPKQKKEAGVEVIEIREDWFLLQSKKGELKLTAQSKAAQEISDLTEGKYIYTTDTESWYKYVGTHWDKCKRKEFDNHLVASLTQGTGPVGFSAGYLEGVKSIMECSGKNAPKSETEREAVPFCNGILETTTGEFNATKPDNAMMWCLPYAYNPDANCDFYLAWLDAVCDDPTGGLQRLIRAVINVCLIPRPDLHFFVHLFGRPRTGKGTFARLLQLIVGLNNFYVSDMELLENSVTGRFETANFAGKRILFFNEFPAHIKTSKFLALTGRDALRFEEKRKQGGASFVYTGLVLMAGNSLFSTDDQTNYAIETRRRTISFDTVMSDDDRKDFSNAGGERLLHEDIPGIITWALKMTREEVSEVFYNPPLKVVEANRAAEIIASPVVKFIAEHIRYDPTSKVYPGVKRLYKGDNARDEYEGQEDKLYPRYLAWCLREGREKPLGRTRAIEAILDTINRKIVPDGEIVEIGGKDNKGTPINGISLVPWEEVYD